jgi:hypothetical protein
VPKDDPVRVLAIVIFSAVSCFSAVNMLISVIGPESSFTDISAVESAYSSLRPYLPEKGAIGYEQAGGGIDTQEYYIAQYALCPLVLDVNECHIYAIKSDKGEISVIKYTGVK